MTIVYCRNYDFLLPYGYGSVLPLMRWHGCQCFKSVQNKEFCSDCYESLESHQRFVVENLEEGGFYHSEELSYECGVICTIPYEKYPEICSLLENEENIENERSDILEKVKLYFLETNNPFCELWIVK